MASKVKSKISASNKQQSVIIKAYLFSYNFLQILGWSYLLYQISTYYALPEQQQHTSLYDKIYWTLVIFQNAAVLEIVHALTKLVPSNPMITIFQVFSRVMVVCGVLLPTEKSRIGLGLPLATLAWSFAEIIRYSYYAFNIFAKVPYFIIYLRYTAFIILYPVGVTGELLCFWGAQKEVSQTKLWTLELPNMFNFSFHYQYYLIFIMLLYIPLFPQMYLHMFAQRKKILGHAKTH